MNRKLFLSFLLFTNILVGVCDKGLLPILPVVVYEPGQKAIISWNGSHELLILSADMYSESETKVLEILPLPSIPSIIELGSFESFVKAMQILEARIRRGRRAYMKGVPPGEDVHVVFHEKLGIHDVTVVEASSFESFALWAEDFLSRNGLSIGYDWKSGNIKPIIGDYFRRGLNVFVFDIVDVKPYSGSNEPLVYMFKSDCLYFPLKISTIAKGHTNIAIFTVTQGVIKEEDVAMAGFKLNVMVRVSLDRLAGVDKRITDMFQQEHIWMGLISYEGPIESLTEDLTIGKTYPNRRWVKLFLPLFLILTAGVAASIYALRSTREKTDLWKASFPAAAVTMMKLSVSAILLYTVAHLSYVDMLWNPPDIWFILFYVISTAVGLLSTSLIWRGRRLGGYLYTVTAGLDLALLALMYESGNLLIGASLFIALIPNVVVLYSVGKSIIPVK